MTASQAPRGERRRNPRVSPEDVRIRVTSGDFEEKYEVANFARRLLNLSLQGMCIETVGRLRPDVKMVAEVRFDDLAATLRADSRIVWVESETKGSSETHKAGLEFVGDIQIAKSIREYLQGTDRELIRARRDVEYAQLKKGAEDRKSGRGRKWGPFKKLVAAVFFLAILYGGSFGGLVHFGSVESPDPGITYRYLPADSSPDTEALVAKVYSPLNWLFRKVGVDLHYRP